MDLFLDTEEVLTKALEQIVALCGKKGTKNQINEIAQTALDHVRIVSVAVKTGG
jgi:hypothetical protein